MHRISHGTSTQPLCSLRAWQVALTITFDAGFVAETSTDLIACAIDPRATTAQFILTDANIIVDPSGLATVTYHASTQEAQTGNGILSSPYTAVNDAVVYARVTLGNQSNVISVRLKVADLPVAHTAQLKGCPLTFDGPMATFNMQDANAQVAGGAPDMTVSYYESQADAEQGTNPIQVSYNATTKSVWTRVTNAAGCYDVDIIQLEVLSSPGVVLTATDNTCTGAAQGSIAATMFDGPSNYTYLWSTGAAQGPLTATTTALNGLNAGQYAVTVTDGNGCTASATSTVEDGILFSIVTIPNYEVEAGGQLGPIVLQTTTWGANFSWTGGAAVGMADGTATSLLPLIPTFTALDGAANVVVSATLGNCTNTATFAINAADQSAPTAVCENVTVVLDANGNATITTAQIDGGSTDSYAPSTALTLTASNTSFSTANLGANEVMLTVTDPSGNTASCMAMVTVQTVQTIAPTAAMNSVQTQSCMAPYEVKFYDASVGNPTIWSWTFPGGVPSTSTEQNPTVVYAQPGFYLAQLVALNVAGESESVTEHQVQTTEPTAQFNFAVAQNSGEVTFTNMSENANQTHWNFGDGTESSEFSPVHTFTQPGSYVVELMITNGCGLEILQKVVNVSMGSVSTEEGDWLKDFRLYPNPNPGVFTVEMTGTDQNEVEFVLYDVLGQIVKRETADFHGGDMKQVFNYGELPPAVYNLGIHSGKHVVFVKVVIQR